MHSLISIFCLRGALEWPGVVTMALCGRPRAPDQRCGLLPMPRASSLELQMPAESDRAVFVSFPPPCRPIRRTFDAARLEDPESSVNVTPPPTPVDACISNGDCICISENGRSCSPALPLVRKPALQTRTQQSNGYFAGRERSTLGFLVKSFFQASEKRSPREAFACSSSDIQSFLGHGVNLMRGQFLWRFTLSFNETRLFKAPRATPTLSAAAQPPFGRFCNCPH